MKNLHLPQLFLLAAVCLTLAFTATAGAAPDTGTP